jgi:cysteine desulfurase family protein (TIGR01976 family)
MSVFPIELVRSQFPALSGDAVFLDNPAGTQVPRQVINAVAEAMAGAASNIGGAFRASKSARDIWTRAHDATAELLGGKSGREVILGQSMTMLTFHISRTLGRTWAPGDEIILTRMDHDANVAPWLQMAEDRGLIVRWLPFNRDSWRIEPQDLEPLLSPRTRLLAVNYASNLTGSINPVAELTRLAKEAGALVYVDAVQLVPHVKADVDAIGCDFLACSSYKFFGPHLGVLWGREALLDELNPYAVRCAPSDLPGRLELGTPQTELFAGLAATADYFVWLGEQVGCSGSRESKIKAAYAAATAYEMPIAQRLIDGLANIEGVRLQGISDSRMLSHRVPTVSFTHARQRNSMLAKALATKGINVWSGHNYALEVVRHLGLDEQEGVLRIGLAHYNTVKEVDVIIGLLEALLAGG